MALYQKRLTAHVATGSSDSSAVHIQGFDHVSIECPAYTGLADATQTVALKGCESSSGTFRPIHFREGTTDSTAIHAWDTGNWITSLGENGPALPEYIKLSFDSTATATAGYSAYVLVNRNI